MSAEESNSSPPPLPAHHLPSSPSSRLAAAGPASRPPASEPPSSARPSKSRRHSIPFAFPPLFQPNTSSTSVIPSIAEGKPIPVDDSTAAGRTSALREFNSNYPSRHRYAKSTGAQNSTYSQPVIVRTYPGPPSRPVSANRGGAAGPIVAGSLLPQSTPSGPASVVRRIIPFPNLGGPPTSKNGLLSMARAKTKRRMQGSGDPDRLPPVEAFSFKSFMANIEAEAPSQSSTISADLDRIAEICARSRYSLSNQYEVHKAPHGSGKSFLSSVSSSRNQQGPPGPTLQAVSSDDERNPTKSGRRRAGGRRRSIAMGTLETIMSSSRSSDEDKTKKRSASEIAEEIRGRASARRESGSSSPTTSSRSDAETGGIREEDAIVGQGKRKSGSFATAVIENTRSNRPNQISASDPNSPRSSAAALLSEPALPQTSTSHLEIRTTPERPRDAMVSQCDESGPDHRRRAELKPTDADQDGGILWNLAGWIPWRLNSGSGGATQDTSGLGNSQAAGSLRELLKSTDGKGNMKGKGIDIAE